MRQPAIELGTVGRERSQLGEVFGVRVGRERGEPRRLGIDVHPLDDRPALLDRDEVDDVVEPTRRRDVIAERLRAVDRGEHLRHDLVTLVAATRPALHECLRLDPFRTDRSSLGDRPVGVLDRRCCSTGEHVGLRQVGEGGRAILAGRHPVDQRRQPAVLFGVGDVVTTVPCDAHRQPAGTRLVDEVVAIDARADPPRRVLGGVVERTDEPGRARRELVQRRILRRLAEPELGELERLVGGTAAQGIRGRTLHGLEHDLDGAGRRGVVGDRHVVGLVGLEQHGERRLVDPAPLPAEESGAHRLADEGVPEREHVDLVLDEKAGGDEPAQRVDQRSLARSGHTREEIERHTLAEDRGGLDDRPLLLGEGEDGVAEELGNGPRQRQVGEVGGVGRASVSRRGDQLFEEERVPAAAVVQRLDRPVRHVVAEGLGGEVGDLVETETVEPDVEPVRSPFDRVEQRRQAASARAGRRVGRCRSRRRRRAPARRARAGGRCRSSPGRSSADRRRTR